MEKINGVPVLNLSGLPLGKAASWLPARLKAEKIVLLPDLCPGKAPLPTGCAIQLAPADEPDWRKYTLSDVGCGIAVYSSPLTLEEFEKRREDWDALALKITARKGGLGELGGGNHFLDAAADPDGKLFFIIHAGSRDEGKGLETLLAKPEEYEREFSRIIKWAAENRRTIAGITDSLFPGLKPLLDLAHNTYERTGSRVVIRKGAVKLRTGGRTLIPSSMEGDMALVSGGRGMEELLNSMSHGTGRVKSRGEAKEAARNYDFTALRKRIYIPAVIPDTGLLTENPSCYRALDACLALLDGRVTVETRLSPVAYIGQV